MHKTKISALMVLLVIGLVISATPVAIAPEPPDIRPMIFVHGLAGSGAQFESQAMRFASNGYPANYTATYEYDSITLLLNPMLISQVLAELNNFIDTLRNQTDFAQVDLIGHSMGTMVCQEYLNSWPGGAAKVAYYVNIDGRSANAPPGGVPTLAIWGMGNGDLEIVGATNVYFLDQSHVQVCTSAESFVEMYKFFTGEEPVTKYILPEPSGQVKLAGRAVIFPLNTGVENATLEIYEVNGDTGTRIHTTPEAIYSLSGDGAWGPFNAKGGVNYEFAILYEGTEGTATHHLYYEPFIRSDYLIRLLTSKPDEGLAELMDTSDHHSGLVITRYKEFWGDQGDNNDILEINGDNIVNAAISPQGKVVNVIFVYDKDADGVSNLTAPIPDYFGMLFMTGVDLYIPAADPPNETISLVLTPRGGSGGVQVINVPNWASSNDIISVQFNDYLRALSWEYVFEDERRGTTLKISTEDKYFQFIAPDKTFSVKHDPDMIATAHFIFISYEDSELKLITLAVDTKLDFCFAYAKDMQTGQIYWLVDWLCGDIDLDLDVDSSDFYIFAGNYLTSPPVDPLCDLDGDNDCDSSDFYVFAGNYLTS